MIGLISDTHGLLRSEALTALKGSDLIIHAGDVGKPEIPRTRAGGGSGGLQNRDREGVAL